jgi:hypothetical protein
MERGRKAYATPSGLTFQTVMLFPGWRFADPGLCYGATSWFCIEEISKLRGTVLVNY